MAPRDGEVEKVTTRLQDKAIKDPMPEGKPNTIAIVGGPQASGKTTGAESILENNRAGYVFDGINLDQENVDRMIVKIQKSGKKAVYSLFVAPLDQAVQRNADRFSRVGRAVNPMEQGANLIRSREMLKHLGETFGDTLSLHTALVEDGKPTKWMNADEAIKWLDQEIGGLDERGLAKKALDKHIEAIEGLHAKKPLSENQIDALGAASASHASYAPEIQPEYGRRIQGLGGQRRVQPDVPGNREAEQPEAPKVEPAKEETPKSPVREINPTPDGAVPETLQDIPGLKVSGDVFEIPTDHLKADPERFQYKKQNETTGVQQVKKATGSTGSLQGVDVWNPQSAGVLDVWRDPADGKVYVVNGHNRFDKALELGVPNLAVKFIDAANSREALAFGARKNLAEGNGTALDAGIFFRESGSTPESLKADGIPAHKKVVQDGMALASLPDTWFNAAANDPDILRLAVETGKAALSKKQADTAFQELHTLLAKKGGDASEVTTAYWKDLVDRIKATRDMSNGQTNLFGEEETQSTLAEQTDLIRFIQSKLGAEKQAGNVLTGKRYQEAVGKAATVDAENAGTMKREATQASEYFKQQKNLAGIGDIINDYAAQLSQAGSAKDAERIRGEALAAVRESIRGDLEGETQGNISGRDAVDTGRGELPKEEVTPREAAKNQVREVLPGEANKALRQQVYQSGNITPESTPEDVVVEAALTKNPSPFMKDPEAGAIVLPKGTDTPKLIGRLAIRLGETAKALVTEPIKGLRNMRNGALLKVAKALDAKGLLQHQFVPGKGMPKISKSLLEGSKKPKLLKDIETSKLGLHVQSPSFILKGNFKPAEGPNIDLEMVANDTVLKTKTFSDYTKDALRRHSIPDHSARTDRVMSPIQSEIRAVNEKLAPLVKTREALAASHGNLEFEADEKTMDRIKARQAEALHDFDMAHQAYMEELVVQKDALYKKANETIKVLAARSPDVRVALLMEPEAKQPAWLKKMAKPNEVRAAAEMLKFTAAAKEAAEKLGIPMRNEEYITHLYKPSEIYTYDATPEGKQLARDILAFHRRAENSINLMPSVHASMAYYVLTISRKLGMQPFLNKWYAGGKNDYLDPNSEFHAPHFGQWLQREITEMQNPRPADIIGKGIDFVKQAEITKLLAFNQKTGVKHVVGKITNLVGLHHTYLLPAMADSVIHMARKAENLPLVGTAFKNTTGRVLDITHMSKADADLVQTFTANLISSRQIRNAMLEDPLIARYSQPFLNAAFGDSRAGSIRGAVQPAINALTRLKHASGQPVMAAEAFENFLNMAAGVRQGEAAGLTPEQNVRGVIMNLLAYSQRGGHDASRFIKSDIGRATTALTQTPSKMMELYADIVKRGLKGEKDIYGSDGTANMVRAMVAIGAVSYLGSKGGYKLYKMLLHPPLVNPEWASDASQYAYHKALENSGTMEDKAKHKKEALLAQARMQGSLKGAATTTPVGDIVKDIYTIANSPKAFLKSIPAVQQIRAEVGKTPQGYKDAAHYLASSPTPEYEKRMEAISTKAGLAKIRKDIRKGSK